MLLNEIKSTIPWEWTDESEKTSEAEFSTPSGNTYVVSINHYQYSDEVSEKMQQYFKRLGGYAFEVAFGLRRENLPTEFNQTNLNESRFVIAAVKEIVEDFIQTRRPTTLFFSAKNAEPSRVSLYKAFTQQFASRGWHTEAVPIDNRVVFVVSQSDIQQLAPRGE